ncbi:hypothetical protein GMD62_16850 [Pseudoflavonifractor sp. BIOML-A14]|nr:hypothetical protein [Pseudoflavonifractor sp. BIOML-A14]
MKRMRTAVTALALTGALAVGAVAATTVQKITADLRPDMTVQVDGEARTMLDQKGNIVYPISYNGTTYLPVRALGEILGQNVAWDSATQTVILTEKTWETVEQYATIGAVEKAMTAAEQDIASLKAAGTYTERAKQYAAQMVKLESVRSSLEALVEKNQEDFRSGAIDYRAFNAMQDRTGAVDVRLKDAQAALEKKTIADDSGRLTAYQEADSALKTLESRTAELEKAVKSLSPASDYAGRVKQYQELSEKLSAHSRDVAARAEIINEDLRQQRLSYDDYNTLSARAGSLDVRLKDAQAALEKKTIADDSDRRTAYEQSAAALKDLERRMSALKTEIAELKAAGDYAGRIKQYFDMDEKLSALAKDVSARYGVINDDLRQGRLTYSEYNALSQRAGDVDVSLKDARASLEQKIFQGEEEQPDPKPDEGNKTVYDRYAAKISDLDGRADKLWKDVEGYKPANNGHSNKQQHKAIFNKIDALDDETDDLEDAIEHSYKKGELSKSQYRALENSLDKVDDKLEDMEDYLEHRLGIDD